MAMLRFRTLMLSIGILCVLTGCGVSIPGVAPPNRAAAPPPMQAATPLDAARMNTSDPNNRRVLAQRPLEDKVVVFYRGPQLLTAALASNIVLCFEHVKATSSTGRLA